MDDTNGGAPAQPSAPGCIDPVFVLCTSRSGSTLLRFLLDAHPDLACPPELKMPVVLTQLARLWSAMETPGRVAPKNAAPTVPPAVAAGIRQTMDLIIGPYLAGRGKKRYCDKNLGTEQQAETLLAVYPEAKFICLYRHPMDMIASGVEACPWGLGSYGFEPYVAQAPGNSVLAVARYWADHVGAILEIEDKYPGHCHRVRYEDLVADPESTAAELFAFLGLPPVPGISALAFSRERERAGPGDFKIWNTSQITDSSVGRGWSVPADLIPPPLTVTLNNLAGRLGYVPIDGKWGTAQQPGDLRLPADGQAPAAIPVAHGGPLPAGSLLVGERLQAGMRRVNAGFSADWQPYSNGSFLLVALAASRTGEDTWWLVDLGARKVVTGSGHCGEDADWAVTAPPATWEQVIREGMNLGIAFRRHGMRYRDKGDGGAGSATAENRVAMMSDLLGVVTWTRSRPAGLSSQGTPPRAVEPQSAEHYPGLPDTGQLPGDYRPPEPTRPEPARAEPARAEPDLDAVLWQAAPTRLSMAAPLGASPAQRPAPAPPDWPAGEHRDRAAPSPQELVPEPPPQPDLPEPAYGSGGERAAPGRRSAAARERIRLERALQARRRRRRRLATIAAVALIAGAVTTGIVLGTGGRTSPPGAGSGASAGGAGFGYGGPYAPVTLNADNTVTMSQPGVAKPVLDVYEDFQCPQCRTFERTDGALIQHLADQGKVKVVYHPFTSFRGQPQQANSVRAWTAAKCVPAQEWARYHNALFAHQPPETAVGGFSLSLLLRLGQSVGVTGTGFAQCVRSQLYAWQNAPLSDQITNSGVGSTLALRLDGRPLDPGLTSAQLRRDITSASATGTAALHGAPGTRPGQRA